MIGVGPFAGYGCRLLPFLGAMDSRARDHYTGVASVSIESLGSGNNHHVLRHDVASKYARLGDEDYTKRERE